MNLDDVRRILRENNINENACLILPHRAEEGALCLMRTADGGWRVVYTERGFVGPDRSFQSEEQALRFFLRACLSDPTLRKDFKPSDFPSDREVYLAKEAALLAKYGLERGDD